MSISPTPLNAQVHQGMRIHRGRALELIPVYVTLFLLLMAATAQADYYTKSIDTNSPSIKNWGLFNTEAPSHIHAIDAWKIEEGKSEIIVAVIDTGIDPNHPSLAKNIWHDGPSRESATYGWNYVLNRSNPLDDNGHGTHVAGIIGAMTDARSGVSGVAHRVSIMPVKYYSESNSGTVNLRNTIQAIDYAVEHGARIINYSGGGPQFSQGEYNAIRRAEAKGVLFVSAAGNEHQDTDVSENFYYPSAYRLSNIVAVAATNIHNDLLTASNWGAKTVDVAAPGENIYSTMPNGRFGYMSGTSQATAFVSGLAALLLSHNPKLTPQALKSIILASADFLPQLRGKLVSEGRVNAYRALLELERRDRAAAQMNDLTSTSVRASLGQ